MAKAKRERYVNLLLSEKEKAKLEKYAEANEVSMNEVLRAYIRTLPE